MRKVKPQYKHDCDGCTFHGRLGDKDIYTCGQGGNIPTIIARWGNGGPEYSSGPSVPIGDMMLSLFGNPSGAGIDHRRTVPCISKRAQYE